MNRFNGSAVYESAFAWLGRYEARLRNTEDQLRFQARQAGEDEGGENAMILRIWKGQECTWPASEQSAQTVPRRLTSNSATRSTTRVGARACSRVTYNGDDYRDLRPHMGKLVEAVL